MFQSAASRADTMKMNICLCLLIVAGSAAAVKEAVRYDPTWDSLDKRPLPAWYDDSKVGIFIHWGIYSAIGYSGTESAWVWEYWKVFKNAAIIKFFADNYPPDVAYADFADQFHATFFDPNEWADVFSKSGAKYIVLTSKHHEGFTLWPAKHSFNWNAMDVGPHRDLVGDLAKAIRSNTKLHFGLYHSLYEWFNPMYMDDKANGFKTRSFVDGKLLPELQDLVNTYLPEVIWSDGDWEAPDTYWNSTGFIAWLYNDSPVKDVVVTNDRWGSGTMCHHGGFLTCSDKYNPGVLVNRKWENAMTLDKVSWGYRRSIRVGEVLTIKELLSTLAATVSCGGNLCVNVGPTADGTLIPVFQERLLQMGSWLNINGEAIYGTQPWSHQNDTVNPYVWYTSKKSANGVDVYAIILERTESGAVTLGAPKPADSTVVTILGSATPLKWKVVEGSLEVQLPDFGAIPPPQDTAAPGVFALKLTQLSNKRYPKRIMALPAEFRKYSMVRPSQLT